MNKINCKPPQGLLGSRKRDLIKLRSDATDVVKKDTMGVTEFVQLARQFVQSVTRLVILQLYANQSLVVVL